MMIVTHLLAYALGIITGASLTVLWAVRSNRELEELERIARDINRRNDGRR